MNKEHQPIQAIFFDIDGTLYDHEAKQIPQKHMQMLHELKKKGIKICLCSGRAWPLLENLHIHDVIEWDGYVCGNGSYVYDKDRNVLFKHILPKESVKQMFDLARAQGIGVLAAGNCMLYTKDTSAMRSLLKQVSLIGIEQRDARESDEFCILSLAVTDTQTKRPEFEAINDIQVLYNYLSVDLMRNDLSKYEGIKVLMDHFGFDHHAYAAFGDALNDLEMLENATLAGAMIDGDPRVLQKINNPVPSVKTGGIYTFLKEKGIL
ncbi:cof-like hydrolase [Firmicutes bacterium M10-2]|nr:cof-like hydrolase [Firmicutes bacterium M10-2]